MHIDSTLENLKELIGTKIDANEIILAFEQEEKCDVYVGKSHNNGYDYIAYEQKEASQQFLIKVDSDDIITEVFI